MAQTSCQEPSHGMDASSRMDICVYHRALSKKKNKRKNLVANACCTLQELARLQAQQQCKQRSQFELAFNLTYLTSLEDVEITLNCASRQKGGANKAKPATILLVAKLDLPDVCGAQPMYVRDVGSDILSEDIEDQGVASIWRVNG
jgi:hypothetical protein